MKYVSRPATLEAEVFTVGPPAEGETLGRPGPDLVGGRHAGYAYDAGRGWLLWVEKSHAWCTIQPGDMIAVEDDGGGHYPIAAPLFARRWAPR